MFAPYGRIVPMHLAIIFGGFVNYHPGDPLAVPGIENRRRRIHPLGAAPQTDTRGSGSQDALIPPTTSVLAATDGREPDRARNSSPALIPPLT